MAKIYWDGQWVPEGRGNTYSLNWEAATPNYAPVQRRFFSGPEDPIDDGQTVMDGDIWFDPEEGIVATRAAGDVTFDDGPMDHITGVSNVQAAFGAVDDVFTMLDYANVFSTPTPNALDDEFDDGIIDGAWSQLNVTGTVTWTEGKHALTGQVTADITSLDLNAILKAGTIAVGESFETMIRVMAPLSVSTGVLLTLTDGTASTSVPLCAGFYFFNTAQGTWTVNGGTMTSYSNSVVNSTLGVGVAPIKVRIRRSASTTYVPEYSMDGLVWSSLEMASLTSSTTFTHFGISMTNVAGVNSGLVRIEYVRKY